MMNKLKAGLKSAGEAMNNAKIAAEHKINQQRDFPDLRSMVTEAQELRKNAFKLFEGVKEAQEATSHFINSNVGVPAMLGQPITDAITQMQSVLDAFSAVNFTIEALIKEEQTFKKGPPAGGAAEITANRKKRVIETMDQLTGALAGFFSHGLPAMQSIVSLAAQLPEQSPLQPVPYEQLYDEPRQAIGAPPAKVQLPDKADGSKAAKWEKLNALPRPIDGDTRAKYAKVYNDEIAQLFAVHRDLAARVDKWCLTMKQFCNFLSNWVSTDAQDVPHADKLKQFLIVLDTQFSQKHIPEFKTLYEQFFTTLETQTAPVPMVGAAPPASDPNIPRRRAHDCKVGAQASAQAASTFFSRGANEFTMFREALLQILRQ